MINKSCRDCKTTKPETDFYKRKDTKDGFYSRCKKCHTDFSNKNKKAYREANKEKLKSYNQDYWQRNKYKYADNARVVAREWYQNNRGRAIASIREREGVMKNATPRWLTPEQKNQIEDVYKHAKDCTAVVGEPYEVDHIVPLRGEDVCGLHVPWNLQVLPMDVNRLKSNKHESEFYRQ